MTTFYKVYELTADQRSLLRDLIVYMMSQGDAKKDKYPCYSWRTSGREILSMLNEGKVVEGMDCVISTMRDAAGFCKVLPEERREELRRGWARAKEHEGLDGVLSMHSNETIEGLRRVLRGEPVMSSTNDL